jgi:very-short-patch-repair endonuclease/predicted transcriptional regulator of viral defense system
VPIATVVARFASLAQSQHGLIRVEQLAVGDQRRLRGLADAGVVERLCKGVYRIKGSPPSWIQHVCAGLWSLGPDAVCSHATAAALHGFDRFPEREPLEFTVGRDRRNRAALSVWFQAVVHSSAWRPATDRHTVRGLAVTSPERTIADLGEGGVAIDRLETAVDSAIRMRLTTLDQLVGRLASMRTEHRRGVANLQRVLLTSGGESFLEREFLKLIRRAGLPIPRTQVVERRRQRHIARVDFLFAGCGVVVEVSGGRGHSSASERAKDARRRNELQQQGFKVLEFTFEMIVAEPARVVEALRIALDVTLLTYRASGT